MTTAHIGVIGGSGLYDMPQIERVRTEAVETPFGPPSAPLRVGRLEGVPVAFLARHGEAHTLLPSELNFRANLYALKRLGVEWVISVSAVGSMRRRYAPTDIVVPDQFYDRTRHRADTFFGSGLVAHVSMADPVCAELRDVLVAASESCGARTHSGGTYLCMEGPQFSTRAESHVYRSWGMDVIGMTNLQEAKLAREAEMSYATLAMVTDYDCWHEEEADVEVTDVLTVLRENAAMAQRVVREAVRTIGTERSTPWTGSLRYAMITALEHVPKETLEKLGPIVAPYLEPS